MLVVGARWLVYAPFDEPEPAQDWLLDADPAIRALFADARIAYINAHNAAAGCFAARIERDGR